MILAQLNGFVMNKSLDSKVFLLRIKTNVNKSFILHRAENTIYSFFNLKYILYHDTEHI